jgi:uncharacterized protein YlxP (DUF503 family)
LHISDARSLKDRRRVVLALKERLRARLPVSVAEVGDVEHWQHAVLAVATVSGSATVCTQVLEEALGIARGVSGAELTQVQRQVIPFGFGGRGLSEPVELARDRRPEASGLPTHWSQDGAQDGEGQLRPGESSALVEQTDDFERDRNDP